jgi:hypothetical protein
MALAKGENVIFTKDVGGVLRPLVRKGTEGTVTDKLGWREYEVTLRNGTKLKVAENEIVRGKEAKSSWWRW